MFQISRQVDYAAQFCRDLAVLEPDQVLSVKEFAQSRNISFLFMQKIARKLGNHDIVTSVRGATGGYKLCVDPSVLTMKRLVSAIEGSFAIVECADRKGTCHKDGNCSTQDTFLAMQQEIEHVLEKTPVIPS